MANPAKKLFDFIMVSFRLVSFRLLMTGAVEKNVMKLIIGSGIEPEIKSEVSSRNCRCNVLFCVNQSNSKKLAIQTQQKKRQCLSSPTEETFITTMTKLSLLNSTLQLLAYFKRSV